MIKILKIKHLKKFLQEFHIYALNKLNSSKSGKLGMVSQTFYFSQFVDNAGFVPDNEEWVVFLSNHALS